MTDLVTRLRDQRVVKGERMTATIDRYEGERAEAAAEIERLTALLEEATGVLEYVAESRFVSGRVERKARATLARIKEPRNDQC